MKKPPIATIAMIVPIKIDRTGVSKLWYLGIKISKIIVISNYHNLPTPGVVRAQEVAVLQHRLRLVFAEG